MRNINYKTKNIYKIAEMSSNHNGDYKKAVDIIYAAKDSGADAIKIQTYTPDTITLKSINDFFKIKGGTIWDGLYMYDLYKQAMTPWDWQPKLKDIAEKIGLDFFSTPFDISAVDFLEQLDIQIYKISSFEVVDIPLLERVAAVNKPVIMSTGMATLNEIKNAVNVLNNNGCNDVALLKCTSAYPAKIKEMNLNAILTLEELFNLRVGVSDHTKGILAPVVSVCKGATIIEKHFCLNKDDIGFDTAFSLSPEEYKEMVDAVDMAVLLCGSYKLQKTNDEEASISGRKSLWFVKDLLAGDFVSDSDIKVLRPGYGLSPKYYKKIVGKKLKQNVSYGDPVSFDVFDGVVL